MTYTGVVFSPKSGFKKIVLKHELILVLNRVSQKYCLHQFFLYTIYLQRLYFVFTFDYGSGSNAPICTLKE